MKQTKTKLLCLLIAALMLLSLAACGKETTKDSNLIKLGDYELLYKGACIMEDSDGNYAIVLTLDFTNNGKENASYLWSVDETVMQNGVELEAATVFADYDTFETVIEGQFTEIAPGTTLEVKTAYVLKDTAAKVEATFEQLFGKKKGTITIDPATLSREASADSTGSTDTTLPAPTGDALLDWWNGAWYGWWTMTGCSGAYESMSGQWWDACAVIDIGSDYTGTVTIWDEDYSRADPMLQASVTLNSAGVGEHGTVMSESGYFTNLPLEHADWIIDPAINGRFPDVENMICIEGWYEDGDDEFYYEVYLRPWGQLWDDFAADYPDDIPYYYDDWYLPLVESGSAMPDVVGGEAVPSGSGGTDAMTQTPTSADAPAAPTAANGKTVRDHAGRPRIRDAGAIGPRVNLTAFHRERPRHVDPALRARGHQRPGAAERQIAPHLHAATRDVHVGRARLDNSVLPGQRYHQVAVGADGLARVAVKLQMAGIGPDPPGARHARLVVRGARNERAVRARGIRRPAQQNA